MLTESKIRGCYWAHSLGDTMGMPVEFNQIEMIKEGYGENGIQEPKEWAIWTDDTEMAFAVTRALMKLGKVEVIAKTDADVLGRGFAEEFIKWHENMGHAPGMTCKKAVHYLINKGSSSWKKAGKNDSKGCGSAMRSFPIGIWFADAISSELKEGEGPIHDLLTKACKIQSTITHGHDAATAAALASSYAVCLAINRVKPVKYVDLIDKFCSPISRDFAESLNILKAVLDQRESNVIASDLDAIQEIGLGWVGEEAFSMALYAAIRFPDDLKKCLQVAVNHDGDSDSVGCIAGSMLGAYHGMDIIPEGWINRLAEKQRMEGMQSKVVEFLLS